MPRGRVACFFVFALVLGAASGLIAPGLVAPGLAQEEEDGSEITAERRASVAILQAIDQINREEAQYLLDSTELLEAPVTLEEIIELERRTSNRLSRGRMIDAKLASYEQARSYLEGILEISLSLSGARSPSPGPVVGVPPPAATTTTVDSALSLEEQFALGGRDTRRAGLSVMLIRGEGKDLQARVRTPDGDVLRLREDMDIGNGWFVSRIAPGEVALSNGVEERILPWVEEEEEEEIEEDEDE